MELTWNLDELFESIEDCYRAFDEIDKLVTELKCYIDGRITNDNLKTILDLYFKVKDISYRCLVYGSLCYYRDIKNEGTFKLKSDVEHKNAETIGALSFIDEMILREGRNSIMAIIESDASLSDYRLFLDDLFRKAYHNVTSDETTSLEKEISDIINSYNALVQSIEFEPLEVNGESIELSNKNIDKYLLSRDPLTRELTFKALGNAYKPHLEEFARLFNELFSKRSELAKLKGYSSVCEKSLGVENIDPKILNGLLDVVKKKRHLLAKYMRIKAEILGLKDAHLYDLGEPLDSGIKRKYPIDEARSLMESAFAPLGSEYISIANKLLDEHHVDASLNDCKHPTMTFSWYSYSFLNYHDAYGDIKNLVHELGHSINDYLSKDLLFPYKISSVFIGETASIVNEILLSRYLLLNSKTDEEKMFYLNKEIDNYVASVYKQTMYTEFELEIYKRIDTGKPLTSEFLSETYFSLLRTYYGSDITYDEESSYEWTRLGHLVRWEFYPYKYATGLLIASTVHKCLLDGSLSFQEYRDFLASGSKEYSLDLLRKLHIDPNDLSILEKGFEILEQDIDELEKLSRLKVMHL